ARSRDRGERCNFGRIGRLHTSVSAKKNIFSRIHLAFEDTRILVWDGLDDTSGRLCNSFTIRARRLVGTHRRLHDRAHPGRNIPKISAYACPGSWVVREPGTQTPPAAAVAACSTSAAASERNSFSTSLSVVLLFK